MSNRNVIRAWKDQEYRLGLNEAERALVPEHPAGAIELSDAALAGAAGGIIAHTTIIGSWHCTSAKFPCCM